MAHDDRSDHWLVRARTVRWLWVLFVAVLVTTLALQLLVKVKGHFAFDQWLGFGAAFGFFACVAMVLVAKVLGRLLKRDERFYGD
ncbi:MAG TPA: hypothetical protein P5528_04525 [Steroidobacteraceae bacterium]|nr:hypothetical protein [Steroidobacteraceae bacterium]HRX88692.1 hypothetical protein [Steroidobacteraceae bacterium]